MIDRKISNVELAENGLVIDNIEVLPPSSIDCLSQLRNKRKIPFIKLYGKIYYQASDLIEWVKSKKVEVAV